MATKKTDKDDAAPAPEPTEAELIVRAIAGLQQQFDGATPTERDAGKDATHQALRALTRSAT